MAEPQEMQLSAQLKTSTSLNETGLCTAICFMGKVYVAHLHSRWRMPHQLYFDPFFTFTSLTMSTRYTMIVTSAIYSQNGEWECSNLWQRWTKL